MKPFIIGCGAIIGVIGIIFIAGFAWLLTLPEGGVRLPNEMEEYAIQYLDKNGILEEGEELLAYYDDSLSLDGKEAAILTNKRVIYHNGGKNDIIQLADIDDIRHRDEGIMGYIFEISTPSGKTIKIEVAALNQGETFKNVLLRAWDSQKKSAPEDKKPVEEVEEKTAGPNKDR